MTDNGERQLHEQFRALRRQAAAGAPEFRDVLASLKRRRGCAAENP